MSYKRVKDIRNAAREYDDLAASCARLIENANAETEKIYGIAVYWQSVLPDRQHGERLRQLIFAFKDELKILEKYYSERSRALREEADLKRDKEMFEAILDFSENQS